MPKTSKKTANHKDMGPAEGWEAILDGYEAAIVAVKQTSDLAPLLKGLPDDRCPCPHWGYVFSGTLTFTFADHTETIEAGEAFYVPPNHTPAADEGTEFLIFSPEELVAQVNAVMERNAQALQGS